MPIYINRNNEQLGPFEEVAVVGMLHSGQLSQNDRLIRQGETEWKSIAQFFPQLAGTGSKPKGSTFGVLLIVFGMIIGGITGFISFIILLSIDPKSQGYQQLATYRIALAVFLVICFIGVIMFFTGLLTNSVAKKKNRNPTIK